MAVELNSYTFGIMTDAQFADHDDALPLFPPIRKRYYRHSLKHIESAVREFKEAKAEFILQLGDLIDGKSKEQSEAALQKALHSLSSTGITVHHTLGNHDLYNFSHEQATRLLIGASDIAYYSFTAHPLRFINLDCYDVAMLGRSPSEAEFCLSKDYLSINPNTDLNSPTGLEGDNQRFLKFNGGLSTAQLAWLAGELKEAQENDQKVVVFGKFGNTMVLFCFLLLLPEMLIFAITLLIILHYCNTPC